MLRLANTLSAAIPISGNTILFALLVLAALAALTALLWARLGQERRRSARLRALARFPVENPSPVLRLGPQGEVHFANAAAQSVLAADGWERGRSAPDAWTTLIDALPPAGEALERDVLCRDGRVFSAVFMQVGGGINVYARDVTRARQAEAQLRRDEAVLRQAGEMTRLGAWEIEILEDGRLNANPLRWSDETFRIFGYAPGSVPVTNALFFERIHPEDRTLVAEAVAAVMAERRPYSLEHRIVRESGEVRIVLEHAEMECDARGRVCRIVGAVQDVTERRGVERELRAAHERTVEVLESIQDGFWAADGEWRLTYVNRKAADLWRRPREELVGRTLWDIFPGMVGTPQYERLRFALESRTPVRFEAYSELLQRWTEASAYPASGGGLSVYFRDISERKQAEEALAAAREAAERARAAAEEADRAKDRFLAVLSHELRTPLTPVLASLALLERRAGRDPTDEESLAVIRRNVELEARLIDDLLDITRIARGKIELEKRPVRLGEVLRHSVEVCRPDLDGRRLEFQAEFGPADSCWVEADSARLQQVFWNLLKNAVKFTPKGGCVGLRCFLEGPRICVEVVDSGEGIDPGSLERIFDAFVQADRPAGPQFGGLGLGLAISKALVELHGGSITACSEGKGRGATFRVALPVAPARAGAVPSAPRRTWNVPAKCARRILLVEDHGDTARMIGLVLRSAGHEVETAGDMAAALELACAREFDLLISDLGLPDGSGLALLQALRSRGRNYPAIALSGYGREADLANSRAAGFAEHLVKPPDLDHLLRVVNRLANV